MIEAVLVVEIFLLDAETLAERVPACAVGRSALFKQLGRRDRKNTVKVDKSVFFTRGKRCLMVKGEQNFVNCLGRAEVRPSPVSSTDRALVLS